MVALEMQLLAEEVQTPVYFVYETEQLATIYNELKASGNVDTAASAFEGVKLFFFIILCVLF